MEPLWLSNDFAVFAVETMIHDCNLQLTLIYSQLYSKRPTGLSAQTSDSTGILLDVFENRLESYLITIIIVLSLYCVGLTIQTFKLIQNLIRVCKVFYDTKKLDLEWFEYIEILNISLAMTTILIFIILSSVNYNKYSLPIVDPADFDKIATYLNNFITLTRINSISCFLIMLKVTIVLKNKFPSFGVIFDTIRKSKRDFINFCIFTIIILFGFVLFGNLAFGPRHSMLSTIQGAFDTLFIIILSQVNYDDLYIANPLLSPIYLILYSIFFFFVLKNLFLVMTISMYRSIKQRNYLILQAKAEIAKEETKNFFVNLMNLLLFRAKNTLVEDSTEYLRLVTLQENGNQDAEIYNKIKILETSMRQQYNKNYFAIFKYNLGQFKYLVETGTLKTNQQMKLEIQQCTRKIFVNKKKKEIHRKKLQENKFYSFYLMKQICLYSVFTGVLLFIVFSRINSKETFEFNKTVKNMINQRSLSQIYEESDIYNYLYYNLFPVLIKEKVANFNFLIKEPVFRITFNKYKQKPNTKKFSEEVIPEYVSIDDDTFSQSFRGDMTKVLYQYVSPGTKETYKSEGGFVMEIKTNSDTRQVIKQITEDKLCSAKMKSTVIE